MTQPKNHPPGVLTQPHSAVSRLGLLRLLALLAPLLIQFQMPTAQQTQMPVPKRQPPPLGQPNDPSMNTLLGSIGELYSGSLGKVVQIKR